MFNQKNIDKLNLSEEQKTLFNKYSFKAKVLKNALLECGIAPRAIGSIIVASDLDKVDIDNEEALKETIRERWGDLIIKK